MAFSEFYIQSTGNDVNAGSDTNNAASVTVTNGNWSTVTNIFIGVTGTEFAGTAVGDYASIYVDGATVAVFIAQITAVGALGVSITVSATIRYGTPPTTSVTARSCKVGGAHASELPWASGGLGATTVPQSTRVNWKQATYTITASRTFSIIGTTTAPLWFRGYNTTPGDCDSNPTLTRPTLALNSTFLLTFSGAYQTWSSINITGSRSGAILSVSGSQDHLLRVEVNNTSANGNAVALSASTNIAICSYCWFKTTTTAAGSALASTGGMILNGCVVEGSGIAGINAQNQAVLIADCVCLSSAGVGVLASTGRLQICGLTVYNATSDGIKWSGAPPVGSIIAKALLANCGGIGINNASGTNTGNVIRTCNDFYSVSGGNESGFGDNPAFFNQTESASPFISTSGSNFGIVPSANAISNGFAPGGFESIPNTISFATIGAVQAKGSGFVPQVME